MLREAERLGDNMACEYCNDTGERIYRDKDGRTCCCVCNMCSTWRDGRIATLKSAACLPNKGDFNLVSHAHDYVEGFTQIEKDNQNWLMFAGRPGTGKTTQASILGREIIERYLRRVRFFNAFDFTSALIASKRRQSDYDVIMGRFLNADVAILDDLLKIVPSKKSFEFEEFHSVLLEALWGRYDSGRPTIITTQVDFNVFNDFDSAFASRFIEKCRKEFIIKFNEQSRNWRVE